MNMTAEDFLNASKPPQGKEIVFSPEDLSKLFWKYKGLQKEMERERQFWASTNENLKLAYERLHNQEQELEDAYERIQEDLEVASQIQQASLPNMLERMSEELDIAIFHEQLRKVGGDYYDFFYTKNNQYAIALFDISGHGVSAALVMAYLKAQFLETMKILESPSQIVESVNASSFEYLRKIKKYSALTFVLFEGDRIHYVCGGGHGIHISDGVMQEFQKSHNFLGLRNKPFHEYELSFRPNDLLVLYTDGIVEAQNRHKEDYSVHRLNRLIQKNSHRTAEEILDLCLSDYRQFRTEDVDDITLIIVKNSGGKLS